MEQDTRRLPPADDIASFLPSLPEEMLPEPDSIYEIAHQATARFIATERHHARAAALHDKDNEAQNHPKAWARRWAADPNSRAQIEEQHETHLTLLRDQLALANDVVARERRAINATQQHERDKVQQMLGQHIWRHIIFPGKSKMAPADTSLENRLRGSALTVVAATGSGKTYIQAEALRDMGIGRPSATDPHRNRRALVCVSDQALVNQYLGKTGDNTFRSVLGGEVPVGAVWQYDKDANKDVTIVVTSTLPELIKTGQIKPDEYDVTIVDEGHRILGRRSLATLRKLGTRLLLFTATPTYDEQRKLERITDVASEGTIRDFVERGILSPVRLLTYRPKAGSETIAAAHLACKAIREGRKVLVYCRPSSAEVEEKDTQYISRLINSELTQNDTVMSAAIGRTINSSTQNDKLIDAFQDGRIRSLVTVNMLREGYNDPEVDTIILIGPRVSLVDIEQKIGRCMRKGDKEALVIELIPERGHDDLRKYYSAWNVFGIESINQGMLIEEAATAHFEGLGIDLSLAPVSAPGAEQIPIPSPNPSLEPVFDANADTTPAPSLQLDHTAGSPPDLEALGKIREQQRQAAIQDYALPADIGGFYDEVPVRSITLSAEANAQEDIKEQSQNIAAIAQRHNLPEVWLRGRFDAAKLPYTSIYEFDPLTGKRKYERWYNTTTLTAYLDEHPLPAELRIGTTNLAQMLGVTKRCLTRVAQDLNITPEPGMTEKDGREVASTFATADIVRIETEIARIPAAGEDDIPVQGLVKEFEKRSWAKSFPLTFIENKKYKIAPYDRRPVLTTGLGTPTDHISATDAERIRKAYLDRAVATTAHISIGEIAKLAGVSLSSVGNHLTEEDREGVQWLRKEPHTRAAQYLPRGKGLAVVERLEQKKLPRYLVPGSMILARVPISRRTLEGYLHRNKNTVQTTVLNLGINKATLISCITWEALHAIEEAYGLREGVEAIDYQRIARSDTAYIYETQALHVDTQYLEPEFEWTPAIVAQKQLGCTAVALPSLLQLVKPDTQRTAFMRKQGDTWEIKTEVLERMGRYPAKEAPPEFISHSKVLAELARRSLSWPAGLRPSTTNARLGRRADGIIDVFYESAAVTAFIRHAVAKKNRPTKE